MSDEKPPSSGSGAPAYALSKFDADIALEVIEPERPDWNHWLKMVAVSIKDALLLSIDTEPRLVKNHSILSCGPIICSEYNQRSEVIKSALLCKELPLLSSNGPWFSMDQSFTERMVKLADFVEWAANVGYNMPTELHSLLDKNQSGQIKENDKVPNMVSDTPTAAIIITQSNQADDSSIAKLDKPLDPREQNTLLKIIAALCERAGITADQDGLDKELEEITRRLQVPITARTIKNHLRKAAELVK